MLDLKLIVYNLDTFATVYIDRMSLYIISVICYLLWVQSECEYNQNVTKHSYTKKKVASIIMKSTLYVEKHIQNFAVHILSI